MSRKRQVKKQQARFAAVEARLQELYRRGADQELLIAARRCGADLPAGLPYGEVVDRLLRRTLATGEPGRLEPVLAVLRPEGRSRPLAVLAAAVVHLGEGRLDAAQMELAALVAHRETAGAAPAPGRLVAALAALCSAGEAAATLFQAPEWRVLGSFVEALSGLAFTAPEQTRPALARARERLEKVRVALGADAGARRLLDAVERDLGLLVSLDELERDLGRAASRRTAPARPQPGPPRPPSTASAAPSNPPGGWSSPRRRAWLDRLRKLAPALAASLGPAPSAARPQRPLRALVHRRWRRLLDLLSRQEGCEVVWADLGRVAPELAALDLELAGGAEEGLRRLRERAAVRESLALGSYAELARRLGSCAAVEKEPERLVQLWALELWAWQEAARRMEDLDDDEGAYEEPAGEDGENPLRLDSLALARLTRIAEQLETRVPAPQRSDTARFLAPRLLDLCHHLPFGRATAAAALALLRHLPNDAGLLLAALAGSVCGEDRRAVELIAGRIAGRGAAAAEDWPALRRLLPDIADELPEHSTPVLRHLRPLVPKERWLEAQQLFLHGLAGFVCSILEMGWDPDNREHLVEDLAAFRALLPESGELAALQAAVGALEPGPAAGRALRATIEGSPGLEPALTAFRVLSVASFSGWPPRDVEEPLASARAAVFQRLDGRWRLWRPLLEPLLVGATPKQIRLFRFRLVELLAGDGLAPEDREVLTDALKIPRLLRDLERRTNRERELRRQVALALERALELDAAAHDPGGVKPPPRRTKPRRRPAIDPRQLDIEGL